MNAHTINLVCSLVTFAAGAAIFGLYWLAKRRPTDDDDSSIEVDARVVIRSYSIYIEAEKVGTCQGATLFLDGDETQLTFGQIVPMSAPHFRKLQRAFSKGERLSVAIGPIDESILQLGMMRVDSLEIEADIASCKTWLEATLSGPTLVVPIECKASDNITDAP